MDRRDVYDDIAGEILDISQVQLINVRHGPFCSDEDPICDEYTYKGVSVGAGRFDGYEDWQGGTVRFLCNGPFAHVCDLTRFGIVLRDAGPSDSPDAP